MSVNGYSFCTVIVVVINKIIQIILLDYFFFKVKNERFLGSSLRPCSGSVCDLPAPPAAPSSSIAIWLIALTHAPISSSLLAWNKYSPQLANLK